MTTFGPSVWHVVVTEAKCAAEKKEEQKHAASQVEHHSTRIRLLDCKMEMQQERLSRHCCIAYRADFAALHTENGSMEDLLCKIQTNSSMKTAGKAERGLISVGMIAQNPKSTAMTRQAKLATPAVR
jgi:hypothetical protein